MAAKQRQQQEQDLARTEHCWRAAVASLTGIARALADKHGHTSVFLPPAVVVRVLNQCHLPSLALLPPGALAAALARHGLRALPQSATTDQSGALTVCLDVPLLEAEQRLARVMALPEARAALSFLNVADDTMDALAQVAVDEGVHSVTLVSGHSGLPEARLARWHAALCARGLPDDTPGPAVCTWLTLADVPWAQRQVILVDRAHRAGSAEHAAWARLFLVTQKRARWPRRIVLAGHAALAPVRPGMGLVHLGLVPATDTLARRHLLLHWLLGPKGQWLWDATLVTTASRSSAARPRCWLYHHAAKETLPPPGARAMTLGALLEERDRYDDDEGRRPELWLDQTTLAEGGPLTLDQWLVLLTSGWAPCYVRAATRDDTARSLTDTFLAALGQAPDRPRHVTVPVPLTRRWE